MINFETIKKLIEQLDVRNLRLIDLKEHKIWEYCGQSTAEVVGALEENKEWLSTYGRCKMLGATETQYKQNWKDCYKWDVLFLPSAQAKQQINEQQSKQANTGKIIPEGYVSLEYANLMAQIESLKLMQGLKEKEMDWKIQMHMAEKNDPMRYLPIAGMFFDIDEKKMANVMKIAQAQNAMNGNNLGMAGNETGNKTIATVEDTDEIVKQIQDELTILSKKVSLPDILKMVKGLNSKPDVNGAVQMLLGFI